MGMMVSETHGRPFVIAVGIDFSGSARAALYLARSLAQGHPDVVIHAVHVTSMPGVTERAHINVKDELEKVREACAPVSSELAGCMRCHVIVGHVDRELVRFACDCGADLLIIGARDRSSFDRLVTGSHSSKIVRSAPCSVLVARANDRLDPSWSANAGFEEDDEERESGEESYGGYGLADQRSE